MHAKKLKVMGMGSLQRLGRPQRILATPPLIQKSGAILIPLEHELTPLGVSSLSSLSTPRKTGSVIVLANEHFIILTLKQKSAFCGTFVYSSKVAFPTQTFYFCSMSSVLQPINPVGQFPCISVTEIHHL